ncbi:MAG: hypothetical protein KF681_01725 [Bdellovibrionaceae bacterium]|nr:hypothetical protein [Pseudobdellovibrionaceae bacterium]
MSGTPSFRLLTLHPVVVLASPSVAAALKAEGYDVISLSPKGLNVSLLRFAFRHLFSGRRFHWIGSSRPRVLSVFSFLIASWTQFENNGTQELDRRLELLAEEDLQQGRHTDEHSDLQQSQTSKPHSEFDRLLTPPHP